MSGKVFAVAVAFFGLFPTLSIGGIAPPLRSIADPAALDPQRVSAVPLAVDYERSTLVAKVKKGGLLRFLGHEHGVIPGTWSAEVRFDPEDLQDSSIQVLVEAPQLIIDSERARRLAGVDPDGPNESEVTEIRGKMLSDEQLDATAFPVIRFESTALAARSDEELQIKGTLTLHGVTRPMDLEADLEVNGSGYVVRGGLEIKLTDFDIEPVSIGGVVKVANDVEISFEIFATPR